MVTDLSKVSLYGCRYKEIEIYGVHAALNQEAHLAD